MVSSQGLEAAAAARRVCFRQGVAKQEGILRRTLYEFAGQRKLASYVT